MSKVQKRKAENIDWFDLVRQVYMHRKKVIISMVTFVVIGILVSINMEESYTSRAVFLSQSNSNSNSGSIGNVAALAGINLRGDIANEIPVGLYPIVSKSINFKRKIINTPIKSPTVDSLLTYSDYYKTIYKPSNLSILKKYTIGLPFLLLSSSSDDEITETTEKNDDSLDEEVPRKLTQSEFNLFKRIDSQLQVKPNEKEGYIELTFTMPDPVLASEMASKALSLLQEEIVAYKINSAKVQLNYIERLYLEKGKEFERKQNELSRYRDRNFNVTSAVAKSELQRLEAEYNLTFNVYQDLARQLENAKVQIKKDTPIFSIIDPVAIPFQRSAPNKPLLVILFFFLGCVFSVVWIGLTVFYKDIKEIW